MKGFIDWFLPIMDELSKSHETPESAGVKTMPGKRRRLRYVSSAIFTVISSRKRHRWIAGSAAAGSASNG